ncbi:H-type lectin domain-containing protein [Motilimonas cestriensis]|uniref:H-type lectin domain-containing protein n=1 Tax=Motilimonas cestriensis TaxID=2742685 RepID=A0ABS8WFC2_9GAMM|nr:H-type lectin domain-containing protein [Motilimonas cestriensis]MCE2596045.1 H-type lectin domain-containing protein [Motilimonas cestriensis]
MRSWLRCLVYFSFLLIQSQVWADTTLYGGMTVGDGNDAIAPNVAVSQSNGGISPTYQAHYPIHFKITAASPISQVKLLNASATIEPAVLVIWDASGNQLYRGIANLGNHTFNISGLILAPGDYQLFAWGQCLQGQGREFSNNCNDWDELSYRNIELVGALSDDIALIQRQHIGPTNNNDGYTGNSLFPNAGSANPLDVSFALTTVSNFTSITLYNLRNPDNTQAELLLIEPNGTSHQIGYISGSGDVVATNPVLSSLDFAPGQYVLRINALNGFDISWDDIVIDFTSRISTLPLCEDVFNGAVNATSSDVLYIPPNNGADGDFDRLTSAADETLAARDYFYGRGFVQFANDSYQLANNSATTRMLFTSNFSTFASNGTIVLNNSNLAENLLIATKANVEIGADTTVNGFIFAEGTISIAPGAVVNGAIAAAGQISNNGTVNYRPDAIANTDFNGMCRNAPPAVQQEIQYGQVALGSVTFDVPFSAKPLVFVMPNLDTSDPDNDGPATLQVTNVTATGFTVAQVSPPTRHGGVAKPMSRVDYVAVLPGVTLLPDGNQILAGIEQVNAVQRGQQGGSWKTIDLSVGAFMQAPAVLLQRHSFNNNCWLTATGQVPSINALSAFDVALEASGVFDASGGGTCVPAGVPLSSLQAEEVQWLAGTGVGSFIQNGDEVRYEFGFADNHNSGSNGLDLSDQCVNLNNLQQDYFTPPLLIANKRTRNGGNGGWARRCEISRLQFGMAVDADLYTDIERKHQQESFSYFAITNNGPALTESLEMITEVDALTCEAHSIKVRALKDGRLNTLYTGLVQLSTSSNLGRWQLVDGAGTLLPNPTLDNGLASYQFVTGDSGEVELSLFHQQGGSVTVTAENISNGTLASANVDFRPYGYQIDAVDRSGPGAGQYHYSNKPFQVTLTAVGKDPNTGSCGVIAEYTGDQQVKLWSSYDAPAQVAGTSVEINRQTIAKDALNAVEQTINFTSGVSAPITVNYPDAGRILLSARDDVGLGAPTIGVDDEIIQGGQLFTFSPRLLRVKTDSVIGYLRDGSNETSVANGVATDDGFIRAALPPDGIDFTTQRSYDTFELKVDALIDCSDDPNNHCATQPIARSFYHELQLSHDVILPTSPLLGDVTLSGRNISSERYPMQPAELGSAHIQHLAWSEVGNLSLQVDARDYLNDSLAQLATPITAATQQIGRFFPAFLLADSMLALPACQAGGFSYLDQQAIALSLTLSAYNQGVSPNVVSNYDTAKGYPTASDTNQNWDWSVANNASVLVQADSSSRLMINSHPFEWLSGQFRLSAEPIGLAKLNPHGVDGPFVSEAPFSQAALQLAVMGKDGEQLQQDANTLCNNGGAAGVCELGNLGSIYYGRLAAQSRHGSELADLRVPLVLERYNGSQFEPNTLDSCTALTYQPAASIPVAEFNWAVDSNDDGSLNQGGNETPIPIANKSSAIKMLNAQGVNGEMNMLFGAPLARGQFSYAIDLNPASGNTLCWLRFDWSGSGEITNSCGTGNSNSCSDEMISGVTSARSNDCARGEVTFGLYRGNDRIIYRLEVNN